MAEAQGCLALQQKKQRRKHQQSEAASALRQHQRRNEWKAMPEEMHAPCEYGTPESGGNSPEQGCQCNTEISDDATLTCGSRPRRYALMSQVGKYLKFNCKRQNQPIINAYYRSEARDVSGLGTIEDQRS